MKSLITLAAIGCAFALNAATYQLNNGINDVNIPGGEIVGIECMTVDASQMVTASVVVAVSEYTNAYRDVVSPHTQYSFTYTNYDGNASVATNVLDRFSYSDWSTNVSWIGSVSTNTTPWTTNWVYRNTRLISSVGTSTVPVTNSVPDGKRLKAIYTKETMIGSGTASSHYLLITPAATMNYFGGKIKVDCGSGDNLTILVK